MTKVLAIVVTYNAMRWVERCLGSLFASRLRPDVLVVDNGSADGTREFVREHFPAAELILSDGNPGFGAANNIGLRLALERGYDFVYLLNQDAWVEKGTLSTLVAAARPDYGILSPVQNDASGRLDPWFSRKCSRYLKAASAVAPDPRLVVDVPFVMAAHWLVSRKALLEVGGFSPAFAQYGEDDNYIDRLHWRGLRCGVVPAAAAVHDRAGRKTPREKRMRLKCIAVVVRLSDPGRCWLWRRLVYPFELAGMSLKNFSLIPLRFVPELRARIPELRRLRKESGRKRAFL